MGSEGMGQRVTYGSGAGGLGDEEDDPMFTGANCYVQVRGCACAPARGHLRLRARQALTDHLRLESTSLFHLIELIVLREAGLALLIDHEYEAHHGCARVPAAGPPGAVLVGTRAAVGIGRRGGGGGDTDRCAQH